MNAQLIVHNRHSVVPHLAGTDRMIGSVTGLSHPVKQVFIVLHFSGCNFFGRNAFQGRAIIIRRAIRIAASVTSQSIFALSAL